MRLALFLTLLLSIQAQAYQAIWEKIQPITPKSNQLLKEPLKVNLNTADKKILQNLNGIGEKKASAIIDYRMQHGSFNTIDELTKVKGFSKKQVKALQENNKDMIILRESG